MLLTICLLIVFGLNRSAHAPLLETKHVIAELGGKVFTLETADSPESRQTGLSGRTKLSNYDGMIFVFTTPDKACFWMKDTNFNLDIFWFDADQKLIYQQQNLSPATYPQNFCPSSNATYVVEINPGLVGLKLGDKLTLQKQ